LLLKHLLSSFIVIASQTATFFIDRFHAKVSELHNGVYNGPATAMANPLIAFTLIKRLQSEWSNLVYSNEASENTHGWFDPHAQSLLSPEPHGNSNERFL